MMLGLLACALGFFGYSIFSSMRVLAGGRQDNRFDQLGLRIRKMLEIAIGQKKMFKEPIYGTMHALIFWGFLVLLLRSIVLIVMAFTGKMDLIILTGGFGKGYTISKDIFEFIVLLMVSYGAFRRIFSRPKRITHSLEGIIILFMIMTLMLTDFLFDGARFANYEAVRDTEMAYAPIGAFFYSMMQGMDASALAWIENISYWVHIAVLLIFMNLLPHSKHFHVITAIPNVFFSKLDPPGKLSDMDFEDETAESFGAGRAEDMSWKQMLDFYTCTECGRCSVNCPAWNTDKPLNPKLLIKDLQHHMVSVQDRLKGKVDDEAMPPMTEDGESKMILAVNEDVIWSCTTCRSCEENCPVMINHVDAIVDLRRYLVLTQAKFPKELNPTFKNLEQKGNPWGLASAARTDWMEDDDIQDIEIPTIEDNPDAEYLFWIGCAGAYDDRQKRVTKALARILNKANVSYATMGLCETCTGDPARRAGNEYLFQMLAQQNVETLNEHGVKKIITHCPHCLNTLMNEYPAYGGNYEVLHHTEVIGKLITEKRIQPAKTLDQTITYHDSCYLGRYNDVYDAPRDALAAIPGVKMVEMEQSRENGMCCGAGGARIWLEERIGSRVNHLRVEQAMETSPDIIASGCPFCSTMLHDGIQDKNAGDNLKTVDIAELVADSLE